MKKWLLLFLLLLLACLSAAGLAETKVFHLCPGVDVNLMDGRYTAEGEEGGFVCVLTDTESGASFEFAALDDGQITMMLGVPVEGFREIMQEQWRSFKSPEMKILSKPKTFGTFMWVPFSSVGEEGANYNALIFADGYVIFVDFGGEEREDGGEEIVHLLLAEGEEPVARPTVKKTATPKPIAAPKKTSAPKSTATPRKTSTPKPTATPKKASTPKPTATLKATSAPKPTEKPAPTATPKKKAVSSLSTVAGYYSQVKRNGALGTTGLILTDGGMGRLLSDPEINFTFWLENGELVTSNESVSLIFTAKGSITVEALGEAARFSRHTPSQRYTNMQGDWTVQEIRSKGETLSSGERADSPWNVALSVYPDGTMDWHAASGESIAAAWEMDGNTIYLSHMGDGGRFKAVYTGKLLKLVSAQAPDDLQIILVRTEE